MIKYDLTEKNASTSIGDIANEMVEIANTAGKPVQVVAYGMKVMVVNPGDDPEVVISSLISEAVKGLIGAYKIAFRAF